MSAQDLGSHLRLSLPNGGRSVDVLDAVIGQPELTRTADGASTLMLSLADQHRRLLRSRWLNEDTTVRVQGVEYRLVRFTKTGAELQVTFEDALVVKLRKVTKRLTIPGKSGTRAEVIRRLCREAGVTDVVVQDDGRGVLRKPVQRRDKATSWDVITGLATEAQMRVFSTGSQLVVGQDPWLSKRGKPLRLSEAHRSVLGPIDLTIDQGEEASTAVVRVAATLDAIAPGSPVRLRRMGAGSGLWIVQQTRHMLTMPELELTLERPTEPTKESEKDDDGGDGE